jgi:dTDP-4-dehydrorhamnose 3,5-epimerase
MKVIKSELPDVLIIEPQVYGDSRGFFLESYNARELAKNAGITASFVQDNHSRSAKNVLRGLHYQIQQPQGKLIRVVAGEVFDVAVDLRKHSDTFGRWIGTVLSADKNQMLWIPEGFAHGFLVLSEYADMIYKTTDYHAPQHERCIAWDDRNLSILWPLTGDPILSAKDRAGLSWSRAQVFP